MAGWPQEQKEGLPSVMREPEPPRVVFKCHHVLLQPVIDREEDGRTVAQTPFNPVPVFHPFDIGEIIRQAEIQARQQWEEQGK